MAVETMEVLLCFVFHRNYILFKQLIGVKSIVSCHTIYSAKM